MFTVSNRNASQIAKEKRVTFSNIDLLNRRKNNLCIDRLDTKGTICLFKCNMTIVGHQSAAGHSVQRQRKEVAEANEVRRLPQQKSGHGKSETGRASSMD